MSSNLVIKLIKAYILNIKNKEVINKSIFKGFRASAIVQ